MFCLGGVGTGGSLALVAQAGLNHHLHGLEGQVLGELKHTTGFKIGEQEKTNKTNKKTCTPID
jgi:hypothetical protein